MSRILDRWLQEEALTFTLRDHDVFSDAVDRMMDVLPGDLRLLCLGEPLAHGEEFLLLRNRLYQRLVERHGFTAIALQTGLTRARRLDEYARSMSKQSLDEALQTGFDGALGQLRANAELLEWIRNYNQARSPEQRVGIHGFDLPGGGGPADGPEQSMSYALDYLRQVRDERLETMGEASRFELEDLICELERRRPELWESDRLCYLQAYQHAVVARALFNHHAALARGWGSDVLLGIREAVMADNLLSILARERGKVLVFAHNSHLQESAVQAPQGRWWPAGAHLRRLMDSGIVALAGALGTSLAYGVGRPEKLTVEAALMELRSAAFLLSTEAVKKMAAAGLPRRSEVSENGTYSALSGPMLQEFEGVIFLPAVSAAAL